MDYQTDFGFEGFPDHPPAGYHLREGDPCPRGHAGLFRDCRHDCAECRRMFAHSWHVTRTAAHSVLNGGAIPPTIARTIGATATEFLDLIRHGCEAIGAWLKDYGKTWGLYHRRPIREFDIESEEGIRAANGIQNLRVAPLHNRRRQDAAGDPEPDLFRHDA